MQLIAPLIILVPTVPEPGDTSSSPIAPSLSLQTELIHWTRGRFRGVGGRTTESRALGISVHLRPTSHAEVQTLARDPLAPQLAP